MKPLDLIGHIFGRLTVLELFHTKPVRTWKCQCSCGNIYIAGTSGLRQGATKSCGCKRRPAAEAAKEKYLPCKTSRWEDMRRFLGTL